MSPSIHLSRHRIGLAGIACVAWAAMAACAWCQDAASELAAQAAILRTRDPALGIRGILRFAVEAAGNRWQPEIVDEALGIARSMQDTTPGSEHFGNYRWRLGDERVTDPNAVAFATELTSLLRLAHAEALSPAARDLLDAMHDDAGAALDRHPVKPGYTNIFLLKIWNHLALGRLGDSQARRRGEELWVEWVGHVRRHGITEYSSPTYYGIDLDCLGLIARHAEDEAIRGQAQSMLTLLWTGIAANWFAPAERLSGAHSRDYDYLFGRGYLDEHLHAAGWLANWAPTESAGWLPKAPREHLHTFQNDCRWNPPADLRATVGDHTRRFVVQRFNAEPWARATNYVGRSMAIGIAGECRGPEDKSLAIHLPGGRSTPNVTLVFDGRDDPYGRHKELVGHGAQAKAHHLRTFLVSSQRGPRITAAWMIDPAKPFFRVAPADLSCLRAHLLLPADAEVWTAGARLADGAALGGDATFFVRKGNVAVGIRSLMTGTDGSAPRAFTLRADAPQLGAQRLTATLSDKAPAGRGIVVLDIEAREDCDDDAFAAFRAEFAGRRATATLTGDRLTVAGSLPLSANLATLVRETYEPVLSPSDLLVVDGREVGRPLVPRE
ncbi:MAG: hypothetical protein ACK54F_08280 [Planctomycetia bacterium]|jgi:hypothetical protein